MDLDQQVSAGQLLLETRVCRVCGKEKSLVDEYYLSRKNPGLASSYSYECKECTVKRTTAYNKSNSSSVKSQYLKRNYGLTFEEFDAMLTEQGNACAVCGTTEPSKKRGRHRRFNVDHNPITGEVRGLLCTPCKDALRLVGDNIHTLENMIQYLHKKNNHETN